MPAAYHKRPLPGARILSRSGLAEGLAYYYLLNDGGTVYNDATGRAGRMVSGVAPTNQTEKPGRVAKFNGSNTFLQNDSYVNRAQENWSLMLVSKSTNTALQGAIWSTQNTTGTNFCAVHLTYSGVAYLDWGGTTGSNRLTYTPAANFWDDWRVMVYVGGRVGLQMWEDGILKASHTTAITRTQSNGLYIGRAGSTYGNNALAAVAQWDRPLTRDEIYALASDPWRVFDSPAYRLATHYVVPTSFTGTSDVTAPAATLTASGTVVNAYTGTSAATAAAATLSATGTVANPAAGFGSNFQLLGIG